MYLGKRADREASTPGSEAGYDDDIRSRITTGMSRGDGGQQGVPFTVDDGKNEWSGCLSPYMDSRMIQYGNFHMGSGKQMGHVLILRSTIYCRFGYCLFAECTEWRIVGNVMYLINLLSILLAAGLETRSLVDSSEASATSELLGSAAAKVETLK